MVTGSLSSARMGSSTGICALASAFNSANKVSKATVWMTLGRVAWTGQSGKGSNERRSKRAACITGNAPHNQINRIGQSFSLVWPRNGTGADVKIN